MYFSYSHFSRSLDSVAEWSQKVPHKSLSLWFDLSKTGRSDFHHGSDAFSSTAGLLGIQRPAMKRYRNMKSLDNGMPLGKQDATDSRSVLVSALDDDFWLEASEPSLDAIWDNREDDVYAELCNQQTEP